MWWNVTVNRGEFVRRAVLASICDDFENLDQVILREVAEKGRKRGVEVARTEMVNALTALVEEGLAKAYMLSCTQPFSVELETMPVLDVIEEYYSTYFLATQRGIELHVAYDASERLDADEGNRQSEG
jgi:hypothetical protein